MEFLIPIVVAVSALWVYLDTTKHRIGKIDDPDASFNLSAWGWVWAVALLWIISFPTYLYKRDDLIDRAKEHPFVYRRRAFYCVLIFFIGLSISLANLVFIGETIEANSYTLPSCNSNETMSAVTGIINDSQAAKAVNARFVNLKDIIEVGYDQQKQVRACSATLISTVGENTLFYSILGDEHAHSKFQVEAHIVN